MSPYVSKAHVQPLRLPSPHVGAAVCCLCYDTWQRMDEGKRLGSTVSKTGKVLRALRPKSEQRCSDGPGENPRGIGISVYSTGALCP